ncbi:FAD:protein FMN transferase [Alteromonadaceae bacterium BrNp21-10]|nr:FAD:protein FMN transferase [Alteromonadaceae bacterium BrNp21-10]
MASPCEILIDGMDRQLAHIITQAAVNECQRIEQKYSRYLPSNLMQRINTSNGKPVAIDDETFRLLSFADSCYQLSDGLFDISSGVLRQAWRFDGSDNIPSHEQISKLLPLIGWPHIIFDQQHITLPKGFELDFGGIGKEYAVDCVAKICHQLNPTQSVLVNFGGDIQVTQPRAKQGFWQIGIEDPNSQQDANKVLRIASGGLATSGDARRFLLKNNKRYGHILNPKTGYPIEDAPRSVTVAAEHCIQSGLLATLALLQGAEAEAFLKQQEVKYWCYR